MSNINYQDEALRYFRSAIYGFLNRPDKKQISRDFMDFQHILTPYLPEDRDANIVEIGCGNGSLVRYLEREGYKNVMGIDNSLEQVHYCKKQGILNVHKADGIDYISGKNNMYNVILGFDILEHFTKQKAFKFLSASYNALIPGGRIVLRVPNMSNIFGSRSRFMDITHEAGYTEHSLRQILAITKYINIRIIPGKPSYHIKRRIRVLASNALHRLLYLLAAVPIPRVTSKNIIGIGEKPSKHN